jgi:hypothetical protein
MRTRGISRFLPALLVAALLCLAAAAPQAPQMPAPNPQAAPCSTFTFAGGGGNALVIGHGGAIRQPLPAGISMAACSLGVTTSYYWGGGMATVSEWDPVALAPDPQTVALRTFSVSPSAFQYNADVMPWLQFVPPLITRALDGVAEPPRITTAIELREDTYTAANDLTASYDPDGAPVMPGALNVPGGPTGAFEGPHPVVAHEICGGDDDVASLRIAQSVRRTDTPILDRPDELAQRFNVPEAVELRWIELAVNSTTSAGGPAGLTDPSMPVIPPTTVAITDGVGDPAPPFGMPPRLVEAPLPSYYTFDAYSGTPAPRWGANLDFDHTITLYPGRDYWLYLRTAHAFTFLARTLTGGEPPEFTSGIGGFYTRSVDTVPWTAVSGSVLAFKIVGRPTATTPSPDARVAFSLRVTPNPAQHFADIVWSGAVAPVRFEVFDARGRRVATSEGGAAGTWRWGIVRARGEPLPAGVYFVHARDSAGGHAVQRLVIYR